MSGGGWAVFQISSGRLAQVVTHIPFVWRLPLTPSPRLLDGETQQRSTKQQQDASTRMHMQFSHVCPGLVGRGIV